MHGWGNLFAQLHETLPCPITRKKCKYKNNVRRCLFKCVQVYIINIYIWFIIQIGETGVVYTRSRRKEVQLAMEGRSAILTQRVRTQIWKSLLWSCISYKNSPQLRLQHTDMFVIYTPNQVWGKMHIHYLMAISYQKTFVKSMHLDKQIAWKSNKFHFFKHYIEIF